MFGGVEDRGVKVVLGGNGGERDIFCGVSEGWNESTCEVRNLTRVRITGDKVGDDRTGTLWC